MSNFIEQVDRSRNASDFLDLGFSLQ